MCTMYESSAMHAMNAIMSMIAERKFATWAHLFPLPRRPNIAANGEECTLFCPLTVPTSPPHSAELSAIAFYRPIH
jgi:hypothetical protein